MNKSEEEYHKKLFRESYNDLFRTKMSLSQKDKERISKRMGNIRSKKEYWLNRENHLGTRLCCSESDWYKLKYAEAKRREYENEIEIYEFYLS